MARFSTSTMLVWEDHASEQVDEAVVALVANDREADTAHAAARLLARRQHEFMHYRQNVSTSLGFFEYRLALAKVSLTASIAHVLGESVTRRHLALTRSDGMRAIRQSKSQDAQHLAGLWERVDAIGAAFSSKNMPVGDLRQHVAHTFDVFHDLPLAGATELRIIVEGKDEERILPGGGPSVEMLSEGLARFHELTFLSNTIGGDALDQWALSTHRLSDATLVEAARRLGVHLGHPVVGALHDLALAGCPDPGAGVGHVIWRSHHPSYFFRRTLDALEQNGRAKDKAAWNIHVAYEVVADAAGTELDQIRALSQEHAGRIVSADGGTRPRAAIHAWACVARASTVSAALYPDTAVWGERHMREISEPPFVVRPHGVVSMWDGRPSEPVLTEALLMLAFESMNFGRGLGSVRRILTSVREPTRSRLASALERELRILLPPTLAEKVISKIAPFEDEGEVLR